MYLLSRLRPNDYEITYKKVPVGRMYVDRTSAAPRFAWTIYVNSQVQPLDGVMIKGRAESLVDAQEAFRTSFEELIAAGTVRL